MSASRRACSRILVRERSPRARFGSSVSAPLSSGPFFSRPLSPALPPFGLAALFRRRPLVRPPALENGAVARAAAWTALLAFSSLSFFAPCARGDRFGFSPECALLRVPPPPFLRPSLLFPPLCAWARKGQAAAPRQGGLPVRYDRFRQPVASARSGRFGPALADLAWCYSVGQL